MTLRPVLKGESIQVAVQGGFVHKPAPEDGIAIDVGDTCGFVSCEQALRVLCDVDALKEKRRRRRRR